MSRAPIVSIVSPLYNSALYVADMVSSVLGQTLKEWQLIVVDDASSDDSPDIVSGFCARDSRIELIRLRRNAGSAVARNTAIEAAEGRYIAFLDADDLWLPGKLESQIEFMQRNQYAFTHTYYEKVTQSGDPTGETVAPPARLSYDDMLKSNQIGCLAAVYDSRSFGKVYMPDIRKRQDYGLWLELLKREPFAYCLPEVQARYRVRSGSISSNKLEIVRYNWELYRKVERFSRARSMYYVGWNIARKVLN